MIKKLLILIIMLMAIPLALASTPNFGVTDNFETDVINNINNIGDLVITTKNYISDTYIINNFDNNVFQQYDMITWNGLKTINVTNPQGDYEIVTTNNKIYVDMIGTYYYHPISNNTNIGTLTISQADVNMIKISNIQQPNGFNISFSKTDFILTDEEVITTSINIDDDVVTGDYEISFDINNKTQKHNFTVLENQNWTIKNGTVENNYIVKSGDNTYAGFVLLENTGNKDVEITIIKKGDNKHLFIIPQTQTLYKKSELLIEFSIQVPLSQKPESNEINITIIGGDNSESKVINITVIDAVKPIIQEINFSTDKAFKQNYISVIATDNNEVANVTLNYDGKTIIFDKDEQLFTKTILFDKLSRYVLNFCAIDYNDNKQCMEINKTFEQTNLITGLNNNIKLPSKKVSQYSKINLFNITEITEEGVEVVLTEFVATTETQFNDSYTVRIIDGDGSVKSFDKYNNKIILLTKGQIQLEIRSAEVADYTGVLSLILPEHAVEVSDISFTVSFKDYDVPESFIKPWSHETDLICNVIDTGNLDDTHYECLFEAPINIRPEDIAIPTTISEREEFENKASDVKDSWDKTKRRAGTIITFLIVVLLLVSFIAYYFIVHFPYVRITRGHKLKYAYDNKGDKQYGK